MLFLQNKKKKKKTNIGAIIITLVGVWIAAGILIPKYFPETKPKRTIDDYRIMSQMNRGRGVPGVLGFAGGLKVADGVSRDLIPGEILGDIMPPSKDYTVTTDKNYSEIILYFWDYAAEEGDYIQILQNGYPISEPFMITHTPKHIKVANSGAIQVKGIKDGRGGITYAVKFETGVAYLNVLSPGSINTYTIN